MNKDGRHARDTCISLWCLAQTWERGAESLMRAGTSFFHMQEKADSEVQAAAKSSFFQTFCHTVERSTNEQEEEEEEGVGEVRVVVVVALPLQEARGGKEEFLALC